MAFDLKDPRDCRIWRTTLQSSLLRFTRFFFKTRLGYKMIVAPHHVLLAQTLERVASGEIKRLIINVAPGYTKTELAVDHFIAWSLGKNPKARFIHVTYSDMLALENSTAVRDIVTTEEYKAMWGLNLRTDTAAKGAWKTRQGGGMQARAAGGPITGFRAGQPEEGFSGAFIMDDMLKPDDAYSEPTVTKINRRFNGVFRSRLMKESETPMILIMQRISQKDPSAFLLKGGTKEKWHHLCLPALVDHSKDYPKEYTHGIPIDISDLKEGPLWEYKHDLEELENLKEADPYTYAAQYDQRPSSLGGGIFKEKWWKYYKLGSIIPEYRFVTADTAQKVKQRNDYSVFQCWGFLNGNLYLIDQIRGKWEAPDLRSKAIAFWHKHLGTGDAATTNRLREMCVEDKVSGTGLIQEIRRETDPPIPIIAIQRNIDKLTRAMDGIPFIASGRVYIPEDAPFTTDYVDEFNSFSADDTHEFDDQIDPTLDAIDRTLRAPKKQGGTW